MKITSTVTRVPGEAQGRGLTGLDDLSELVDQYHESLSRLCFMITGDAEMAADAVQETWSIAIRKVHRLRRPESAKAWLMAVAANQARQELRARKRRERLSISARERMHVVSQPDPDLAVALARLNFADRQLLSRDVAAGLTSAEIGAIMGLSAEGVRTRKHRLLKLLREELGWLTTRRPARPASRTACTVTPRAHLRCSARTCTPMTDHRTGTRG